VTGELLVDDLGVVVLAYGRQNGHAELIGDLQAAGLRDERLIVVHNPDRPDDAWGPFCPDRATLIPLPRNLGYAAAMNNGIDTFIDRGLKATLLLTHDARVDQSTLRSLLRAANSAPGYGVLGLAVRGAGGVSTSFGSYMRSDGVVEHITEPPPGDIVADSVFVDGSAMFLRLDACGRSPLPERYFMYFEDAEICSAVRERGWKVGTALEATASSVSGSRRRRAAFQYFYVRNGLDWKCRHEGRLAAGGFLAREMWRAWTDLPKPGGQRFHDRRLRRVGYEQLIGRALGLWDFLWRHWGPPPEILRNMSDIRNV
jgi:GT2 family glycosyltransferase